VKRRDVPKRKRKSVASQNRPKRRNAPKRMKKRRRRRRNVARVRSLMRKRNLVRVENHRGENRGPRKKRNFGIVKCIRRLVCNIKFPEPGSFVWSIVGTILVLCPQLRCVGFLFVMVFRLFLECCCEICTTNSNINNKFIIN